MENKQSNDDFVPAGVTTRCVWNSAPIDGTDFLRVSLLLDVN